MFQLSTSKRQRFWIFPLCLQDWGFLLKNTKDIFKGQWNSTLCFILWMTELCWFYNIQLHMTTERYYVGFIPQQGLLNPILHLWHSQKHQMAIEDRQGSMKYSQAHSFSIAWGVIWIFFLLAGEGELASLEFRKWFLDIRNVDKSPKQLPNH